MWNKTTKWLKATLQGQLDKQPPHAYFIDDEHKSTALLYAIPSLGLDDGAFLFSYLANFLSYITRHDITLGAYNSSTIINKWSYLYFDDWYFIFE